MLRSVEPLYEEDLSAHDKDLLLDQSLVGSWWHEDKDCPWTLAFAAPPKGEFTYELTLTAAPGCETSDVHNKVDRYDGHVVELDNNHFLDVVPKSNEVCDACLALHVLFRISEQDNKLTLTPIDGEWLKDATTKGKVTLAHLNDGLTVTASSKDLKAFVRKYASDPAAFKPDPDLTFQRK